MLVSIEEIAEDVSLGLWKIERNETLSTREKEHLAVRSLLSRMTGMEEPKLCHAPSGKPHMDMYNVSISHTRGYAAIILSRNRLVGVDIEYMSERVNRIAERFMRNDEKYHDTCSRLIVWCAKETVYKLCSEDNLTYNQMRVTLEDGNNATVENLKGNISIPVCCRVCPDFVLTYSFV